MMMMEGEAAVDWLANGVFFTRRGRGDDHTLQRNNGPAAAALPLSPNTSRRNMHVEGPWV